MARTPTREDIHTPLHSEQRLTLPEYTNEDQFYIDPEDIPPGVTYEWKRVTVYGKMDAYAVSTLKKEHWSAVPASRHPHLAASPSDEVIERGGLLLMERPAYVTAQAHERNRRQARQALDTTSANIKHFDAGPFERKEAGIMHTPFDIPA